MDATINSFLEILRSALRGEQAAPARELGPEEWRALFRMAGIHNVLPLFFGAAYTIPSLSKEPELLASVKQQVRQQVILQSLRTSDFLALNHQLQEAGIHALVVKGLVCRDLYPQPDHRPSSDEDILIPEAQFALCHQVLTAQGMTPADEQIDLETAHEVPYRKAGSPLYIELHKYLFPPESEAYGDLNRFFDGVFDRADTAAGVDTLCPTDHLFYLICHAFKHFLHSGFGIRQVCDIVLYANRYGREVNWQQTLDNCRSIRAEKFAAAIFRIGSRHLVFDPDDAAFPDAWREIQVDDIPMLEDLLSGGLYGGATASRKHSSNITLEAVAAQKQGRQKKGAVISSLFPSAAKLERRYPYLQKYPYLLPAAWCSRLWSYAKEARTSRDNNAADTLKIGSERVELLKLYGILE